MTRRPSRAAQPTGRRPDRHGCLRQGGRLPPAQGHRPRRVRVGNARQARPTTALCRLHAGGLQRASRPRSATGRATSWSRTISDSCSPRDSPWRDRRARPAPTAMASTIAFAVDDVESALCTRPTAGRLRLPPDELDGGEDGTLRRASIPPMGRSSTRSSTTRLPRDLRPGYRAVKSPASAAGGLASRGRSLCRQRRARRDGQFVALFTSAGLHAADPHDDKVIHTRVLGVMSRRS